MKIYIYKEEEITHFPKFQERPWIPSGEGVIEVQNPKDADFIICPVALHRMKSKDETLRVDKLKYGPETLKYWNNYENKHIIFDCSDYEVSLGGTSATLIRCNVRDFMINNDKNTIPWYWPVEDLGGYTPIPEGGLKYDVGFQGWLSTKTRKQAVESCKSVFGDKCYYKTFTNFYGLMNDKEEQKRRRESFLKTQQETLILLAPQSIHGVFPYRFYEAMSAGRIPALFCTGYHLPFQDEIDWDKCTLRYDAEDAPRAGKLIKAFLDNVSDKKLIEMATYGREMWYKWLNRDKQSELITYVLKKKIGE